MPTLSKTFCSTSMSLLLFCIFQSLSHASEPKNLSPILGMLMDDEGPARSTVIFQDNFEKNNGWFIDEPTVIGSGIDPIDIGEISNGTLHLQSINTSRSVASIELTTPKKVNNFTWEIQIPSIYTSGGTAVIDIELEYDGVKILLRGIDGKTTVDGVSCLVPSCSEIPIRLLATYRNGEVTISQNDNPSLKLGPNVNEHHAYFSDRLKGNRSSEIRITANSGGSNGSGLEISEIKLSSF